MTDLTREQLEALLDGATQGPWQADGEPWNRIVWSSAENRVCFMAHSNGLDDARDIATSNLVAAAPDIARQLLATMTERDEAQAAQAIAAQCCICGKKGLSTAEDGGPECELHDGRWVCGRKCWEVASDLADPTGVKLLAELRAERDHLLTITADQNAWVDRAKAAEAQLAEAKKRGEGLKSALDLAIGLGIELGMSDIEIDTIGDRAALSAAPTGEESNG